MAVVLACRGLLSAAPPAAQAEGRAGCESEMAETVDELESSLPLTAPSPSVRPPRPLPGAEPGLRGLQLSTVAVGSEQRMTWRGC